jgi:RinA family phage transcriptional activator
MNRHSREYIKGILRAYPFLEDKIAERKLALLHPESKESDENIGGGSSNRTSDVVAAVAVKIADDEDIQLLERYKRTIGDTLQGLHKDVQDVIDCRYLKGMNQKETADKLGLTVAMIRCYEEEAFRKLCKRLNLLP